MLVLVSRDGVLSEARVKVMSFLFDAAVHVYPTEGLRLGATRTVQDATDVWIGPEAREGLMLRVDGATHIAVLRAPSERSDLAWSWFLAHACPAATIRAIGQDLSARNTFSPAAVPISIAQAGYTLSFLKGFFHDLKKFAGADVGAAQEAAKWLTGIPDAILRPFHELTTSKAWSDWRNASASSEFWDRRSILFEQIGGILKEHHGDSVEGWVTHGPKIAAAVRSGGVVEYWQQLCSLFESLADDPKLASYRSPLEQFLTSISSDRPSAGA